MKLVSSHSTSYYNKLIKRKITNSLLKNEHNLPTLGGSSGKKLVPLSKVSSSSFVNGAANVGRAFPPMGSDLTREISHYLWMGDTL